MTPRARPLTGWRRPFFECASLLALFDPAPAPGMLVLLAGFPPPRAAGKKARGAARTQKVFGIAAGQTAEGLAPPVFECASLLALFNQNAVRVQTWKHAMNWPHAPDNWLFTPGHYFVTAGTLRKIHLLDTPERLSLVRDTLFEVCEEYAWALRAWAIMINHYHFVARSPTNPETLRSMLAKLHGVTARALNANDNAPGRRVWYRFMSAPLTFERSLLARLHYTHFNPQRHNVVKDARTYAWCSANWFERSASSTFVHTVASMKSDGISDDY